MKSLVSWLIWMLLAQQIYTSIENHPEIWKDLDFWAALFLGLGILAAIQFKLIHDQMEAKYSGENANLKSQIELIKQQKIEPGFYETILRSVEEPEIKVLQLIEKFERQSPQENLSHYSVEQLEEELSNNSSEANEIIKKLKKLDLVICYWENVPTFVNLSRPINEEKPVRLTALGREFLVLYGLKNKT
jgi:hypothetical protein